MLQQLRDRGLWEGYDRRVRQLESILTSATDRGIPINETKRLKFKEEVTVAQAELDKEIQFLVPDHLRNCEPKNGYVNPKIVEKTRARVNEGLAEGEKWGQRWFGPDLRWCRLQPFLPNSSQQILRWIKWQREQDCDSRVAGYRAQTRYAALPTKDLRAMAERNTLWRVPKEFKTDRETTAKKELDRLGRATGSAFFAKIIQHREYGKIRSTYVEGWAPAKDGCVHGTFTFAPATGQLSAVNPNILNPIKHGRLAKPFREIVEAKDGHVLIEVDATAFHARTLGLEAQDADYMRLAALDIHSFVAAHMLKLPGRERLIGMADQELKALLKSYRKDETKTFNGLTFEVIRNEKAKRGILGIGFGLGANKLYDMNMESFANKAEAKQLQDLIKGLFPKIFLFQDAIRLRAHKDGNLKSRYGFMRWFWDVYHWDSKKNCQVPGADSEAAIAFLPANDAFGMIRETILRLEARGLCERFGFVNTIHDSLMFHCRKDRAEECIGEALFEMESPSLVLRDPIVAPEGFTCGAEAQMGLNWRDMKEVKWNRERKALVA
jgi:hypothetical protein